MNRLEKHSLTESRTCCSPRTPRWVSYCPAKLASGKSSAVELERTATSHSCMLYCLLRAWYFSKISSWSCLGYEPPLIKSRIFVPVYWSCSTLVSSKVLRISSILGYRLLWLMKALYPSVVTTYPSGTEMPLGLSSWSISPRDAFLPPTVARSLRFSSFMNFVWATNHLLIEH